MVIAYKIKRFIAIVPIAEDETLQNCHQCFQVKSLEMAQGNLPKRCELIYSIAKAIKTIHQFYLRKESH